MAERRKKKKRRVSLRALAKSRGFEVSANRSSLWQYFARRYDNDLLCVELIEVRCGVRRAAEEGLRAALEAMPVRP